MVLLLSFLTDLNYGFTSFCRYLFVFCFCTGFERVFRLYGEEKYRRSGHPFRVPALTAESVQAKPNAAQTESITQI